MVDCENIKSLLAQKSKEASAFYSLSCLENTASTNEEIKRAISNNEKEGYAVLAMQQHAGYGRQGRGWVSPLGGLYVSFLLKPSKHDKAIYEIPSFGLVVGLVVRKMLLDIGCLDPILVKWPNDVLCEQGKLSGISLEMQGGSLCVGVGINFFQPTEKESLEGGYAAAYAVDIMQKGIISPFVSSDKLSKGQTKLLEEAASVLLGALFSAYRQWLDCGFSGVQEEYEQHSSLLGQKVKLASASGNVLNEGIVCGFDEQGRMHLQDTFGKEVIVVSGEVHII